MLAGLVNTGPTLNVPVPDSKDRKPEATSTTNTNKSPIGQGQKFSDVLDSKGNQTSKNDEVVKAQPGRTQMPSERLKPKSSDDKERAESQDDSDNQTETSPPDPKVMDPRTSALRAQREKTIRKFMDSFESEFGVPPEEMVEVMSQLTTQDLEKPPEKTVDNIISKLDLSPQDELKAKKMYLGLLMQLKQIDVRQAMPKSQDDMLSSLSAQRVLLSAEKKDVMANQVQGLSDKFWMKGAEKATSPEMNQLQVREFLKKMVTAEAAGLEGLPENDPQVAATTENVMKQLEMEVPELGGLDQLGDESYVDEKSMQMDKSLMAGSQAHQMKSESQQQMMSQNQNGKDLMDQNPYAAGAEGVMLKKAISREAVQAEFKKLGIKPSDLAKGDLKKIEKADVEALLNGDMTGLPQAKLDSLKAALAAVAPTQAPVDMTPAQKAENIQQIMNQAQILLKKGGGEVKVEMTPEGMGSIQMKLQVLDGKVQVHMNTETKEAKKLIEASMHDLKQSLAAHQLSMDLVKVDVVNQTTHSHDAKNDLQNQMQNLFNHQQKEGTRQFWNQFNENFGNRQSRENFYDAQNIRGPTNNQLLPGFGTTSNNSRAQSDGRGKSLNLVA